MKSNQIRATLEGLGTEQNVMYTNEEIIENLDELQRAMASGLFAATHVECARARDIMAGIERLAIEHGLESTPEFQRLNSNMSYLGHTIGSLIKGRTGERNTMKALQLLALDKSLRILYNIAIQDGDAQTEYDAIVLAPYGVFAVEVKNYNESMRITESGMLEKLENPNFQYNLGGRMNCKEYLLRKVLKDALPAAHYHGLLLYANEYSRLVDDFKRIQICYRNTVVQDIQAFDTGATLFSQEQLAEMERTLESVHSPRRYPCRVNCDAIKEDFSYLMEQMAPTAGVGDEVAADDVAPDTPFDIPMKDAGRHFPWKEFWYGVGTGAALAGAAVFTAFKLSNTSSTRA